MKFIIAGLVSAFSVTAFAVTTPVTPEAVKAISDQLQKQNGTIGKCREFKVRFDVASNPLGQQESKVLFDFIARDGKTYGYFFPVTPKSLLVGEFDKAGTGSASFFDDDGRFTVSMVYFEYTAGAISNFFLNGAGICD